MTRVSARIYGRRSCDKSPLRKASLKRSFRRFNSMQQGLVCEQMAERKLRDLERTKLISGERVFLIY